LNLLTKPKHQAAKFTCKDYLAQPQNLSDYTYNHILLYKSIQSYPLRQNVKSFKAFEKGTTSGVEASRAMAVKGPDKRPQSAVERDKIKYKGIREYLRRKRL
jgi:hypothetical protein